MNLPTSIIRSSARLTGAAGLVAALLMGCGGSAPRSERETMREADPAPAKQVGEKGTGGINFRYSNQSTDARMDIDLGSTDVYLEMSGKPANVDDEVAMEHGPKDKRPSKPESPKKPGQDQQPDEDKPSQNAKPNLQDLPQDDQVSNEDVTGKVLAGIRKAQELFYQKRYPEALQIVRQSLDAQPTAEGHALAGSICYMMSKNGLARRHWEEALRLNPDMPAVVNMLERTRMPGGRGSPSPRPISSHPAARPPASVMKAAGPDANEAAPLPEEAGNEAVPQPASRPSAKHIAAPAAGPAAAEAPAAAPAPAKGKAISNAAPTSAPAPLESEDIENEDANATQPATPAEETPLATPAPTEKSTATPAAKTPPVKPVFPTQPKAAPTDSAAKADKAASSDSAAKAAKKAKGK